MTLEGKEYLGSEEYAALVRAVDNAEDAVRKAVTERQNALDRAKNDGFINDYKASEEYAALVRAVDDAEDAESKAHDKRQKELKKHRPKEVKLIRAIGLKDVDEVKRLITAGADINDTHVLSGMTPLMFSAGRLPYFVAPPPGESNEIDVLLEAGADINIRDRDGNTAIIYASRDPMDSCYKVDRLLSSGADVNNKNNKGETPYSVAMEQNNRNVALCLKKYFKRCKNGTRRSKKTGKCEPIQRGGVQKKKPRHSTRSHKNRKTRKYVR
jgi:uncharacterized protein (UPF0212 family)